MAPMVASELEEDLDSRNLEALIECLEEDFGPYKRRAQDLLRNHKAEYNLLWCIFPPGSDVAFNNPDTQVLAAGRVRSPLCYC